MCFLEGFAQLAPIKHAQNTPKYAPKGVEKGGRIGSQIDHPRASSEKPNAPPHGLKSVFHQGSLGILTESAYTQVGVEI